jgi:monofunctional biosynthetic peptidoglycan transglycosylase
MARRKGKRRSWLARAARVVLVVLSAVVGWQALTWPHVGALARTIPESTAFIDAWRAEQRAAGKSEVADWRWVPYPAISAHLKRAVLVSEDIDFFSHHGFAVGEIETAIKDAIEEGEAPRGASTITQQVAKNLWLSPSRNPLRKLKEAILTWQLERTLGKKRIFEIYLDVAEFGNGLYGAEAASRRYFGKAAADLDEREAAELAAGLPSPRLWHPGSGSRVAAKRAERILGRMRKAQFLWRQI